MDGIFEKESFMKMRFALMVFAFTAASGIQHAAATQSRTTYYYQSGVLISSDSAFNATLPDGYFLTGTVTNSTGTPLKGAYVGSMIKGHVASSSIRTDSSGKFSLPLPSGSYSLDFEPPASSGVNPATYSRLISMMRDGIAVSGDTTIGSTALQNGFILSGHVNPPAGSGTAIAWSSALLVIATSPNNPSNFANFGSGPDMMKYITAVPSGKYNLVLVPIFAISSTGQPIPAAAAQSKITLTKDTVKNITASKGYPLTGSVSDSSGAKLSGLIYFFSKGHAISPEFLFQYLVGVGMVTNGKYSTFLMPGGYTAVFIPVADKNYKGRAVQTTFDITMTAAAKTYNFPAANGVIVTGKVTDARNKASKSAIVEFSQASAIDAEQAGGAIILVSTATDVKGQYRVLLPAGTYDFTVEPPTKNPTQRSHIHFPAGYLFRQ